MHPILAERVRRVHRRIATYVNSGHRSSQDQQLFWDCAQTRIRTGTCPKPRCSRSSCASANRPGQSNHEAVPYGTPKALAVDMEPVNKDWATFRRVCREEKLHDPIANEDWHWQPIEVPTSHYAGMPPGW